MDIADMIQKERRDVYEAMELADRRLALLRRARYYIKDYIHIFDGDRIEDLNELADCLDAIEKELGDA